MTSKHGRPPLSEIRKDSSLNAAQECRDAMLVILKEAPIGSCEYRAASAVTQALDGLADALRGDRHILQNK